LISLDDIRGSAAITLLAEYKGINPYLKKLRNDYLKNKKISLTDTQEKYIIDNHDKEPLLVKKVVRITKYLGEELQKQHQLKFTPEKMLIEYILADTEKTYHVYGKLKQNQAESAMYWLPKTQVLDDPYFTEIDIDVNFDRYNSVLAKTNKKLFEHQEKGIKFLLARNGCILADDMGLGKVIANDVPVLTPNGWVNHGSLRVGDFVIGSDGKPTKIKGVFPKNEKNYYNITFTDGTIVESCDEHLWAVQTTNHKKRGNGFLVKELKELMNDLTYGSKGNVKWYIPMVKPVEFNPKQILLDPYLLGVILGDGGISQSSVTITNIDTELINEINTRLPNNHHLNSSDNIHYNIVTSNYRNGVKKLLFNFNLIGLTSENKFIPEDYKYNSINIRLELLQGLLDTDGYCNKDGTIQYYSVSKKLSDDVKEIVQSLGGVARQSSKIGKYKKNGLIISCKRCFILTINLPQNIIPFKLSRKINRLKKCKKYKPSRGIKKIEFSRKTFGQCISVEAEDQLYVIDKYVVTHNTVQSIVAAEESGAKNILIICPASAKINWQREINMFCNETVVVDGSGWKKSKYTIINYDILKKYHTVEDKTIEEKVPLHREMVNSNFDLVIIDEAHCIKDSKANRSKIVNDLVINFGIPKVWLLTGTPVANRPIDVFNLLKLIKSPIANNWDYFTKRYCDAKIIFTTLKNGKKKKVRLNNGASNLDELAQKTRNILLRRLKSEVLDMPKKLIIPVYHELSDTAKREYDQLWDNYLIERKNNKKRGTVDKDLVEVILLRKFIAMETIPQTIDLVDNALEMDKKVIIFTNFTDELMELHEYYGKKSVIHYGGMSNSAKQNSVDAFQNNEKIRVFIGNEISAGVAITLTKATVVVFNSFSWVPGLNEQAEDRCYRLGQNEDVNVYYQLFIDTITTRMWETLLSKQDIISIIMSEKHTEEELIEIMTDKLMEDI
jgi:hypothetical protein